MLAILFALALQAPVHIGVQVVKWNFPDALAEFTRFTVCFDEKDCVDTLPAVSRIAPDSLTPAGSSAYAVDLPAFKIGVEHSITVTACNIHVAEDCEREAIRFLLSVKMVKPTEVRPDKK